MVETRETGDDYVMIARAGANCAATQYVGAGRTASGYFADVEAWWRYRDTTAQRLEHPIRLLVGGSAAPASRR